MNKETILWATPVGEPEYMEVLITSDASRIPAAKAWAESNGFDRFRTSELDLDEKPNFNDVIN